ncbi:MAG: 4Fe-4S dicluster domain-containing protein [Ruminococcaceae bacterium]|nr:4Fe-4S dicluster domain-containing protein [Oscillospiraceae bacterium]
MKYIDFQGKKISMLGYGAMRLPTVGKDSQIDYAETERLFDRAIDAGINYFDTAYPYHGGNSEIVVGKILSKYPRESYYIATKYPGHQILPDYNPAAIFEDQLKKCGVEYFDFYLLHNVCETSLPVYLDKSLGIIDYFLEQKRLGRIKHLGFSTHGSPENMSEFLDAAGEHMEFCQIQLNYLDWTLQRAEEKCRLLEKWEIPVWVMEPVRGGKLVNKLPDGAKEKLRSLRPDESLASWCFRWLTGLSNMGVILSGMSNMEQLEDNIKTFSTEKPLTDAETAVLYEIADGLKSSVPCTSCGYCLKSCPMELNIPMLLEVYNDLSYAPGVNSASKIEFLPENKQPTACIACSRCVKACPQNIDIPLTLIKLSKMLKDIPSWRKICEERAAAAEKTKK